MANDTLDVAFMFPPGMEFRPFKLRSFENHLGVAYIQAYLAKHGFSSKQVIPPLGSTLSDCVEQLIATNAKIIGFTCYDTNYFLVRTIASFIKRKKPETIVIAGGPTPTFSDDLLLNNAPDIDLCVRFEGEETTLELVSLNTDGSLLNSLEDVAGITYRHNNSIVRTTDRQLFGASKNKEFCLDDLPSPYLDGVLDGTEGAGILTARGCTHHCSYCNFSAMSKHIIRYHSIDRVIDELKYIYDSSTSHLKSKVIVFNDDAFTLNVRRAKNICKRIIDEGIKLKLSCLCRADNLDEELIELLNEAGFGDISFGVESAVPKILSNIKKIRRYEPKIDEEDYAVEESFLSEIKE
jgi:anaerobic magnesium-protoporphyrin IX monomethyl ester cyclase